MNHPRPDSAHPWGWAFLGVKRKNYSITSTAGHLEVKHAWNSAVGHVEGLVRLIARDEATIYDLTGSETTRDADNRCVSGTRTWTGRNGHVVTFTIAKL